MCGRYALTSGAEVLAELFGAALEARWAPRYNVAPTQLAPVVRAEATGERRIALLRWGLVPTWARDPSIGNRMINARSETAATKPAFRAAMRRRRCLVPIDGFYEWRRVEDGKQPHFIHARSGRPLALAGLWESWSGGPGKGPTKTRHAPPDAAASSPATPGGAEHADDPSPLLTYTILTTAANALVAPLHDRMPVILPESAWSAWLDPEEQDVERLAPLLVPAAPDLLAHHPVTRRVNRPAFDDPACVLPLEGDEIEDRSETSRRSMPAPGDSGQGKLFGAE